MLKYIKDIFFKVLKHIFHEKLNAMSTDEGSDC